MNNTNSIASMLANQEPEQELNAQAAREVAYVRQLNREAYWWLGRRMERLQQIRRAGRLEKHAAGGPRRSLESDMEATRSALGMVTKVFRLGLVSAYNSTVDELLGVAEAKPLLGPKLSHDPQSGPPVSDLNDALLLCWAPLRFLNIASSLRSGGRGLEFYSDELAKKVYFKVIAYYCRPERWDTRRLGRFVSNLGASPPLDLVRGKLHRLKTDIELLTHSHHQFYFQVSRSEGDDLFAFTSEEAVRDLYLQSWLLNGFEQFVFRYCLCLLEATESERVMSEILRLFRPLLKITESVCLQFYFNLANEPQRARLRPAFVRFAQQIEAGAYKGSARHHQGLIDAFSFSRVKEPTPVQRTNWNGYLQRNLFTRGLNTPRSATLMAELLNLELLCTQDSAEVRKEVAQQLQRHTAEQEAKGASAMRERQLGIRQQLEKKRQEKSSSAEIEAYKQAQGKELDNIKLSIQRVIAGLNTRTQRLLQSAEQLKGPLRTRSAKTLYALIRQAAPEGTQVSQHLLAYLKEALSRPTKSDSYTLFYQNLFEVIDDIPPLQRFEIRQLLTAKLGLAAGEPTPEERRVVAEKQQETMQELELQYPGMLQSHIAPNGHINISLPIFAMLKLRLGTDSLRALLTCPMQWKSKTGTLPEDAITKLLALNSLQIPLPQYNILFPGVPENAPSLRRINFQQLRDLISRS